MVARLDLADQRGGDRGHAARGGARGLRAFEQRHALLEHRDRRVGEARIDETRVLAFEARLRVLHRVVEIALGQEQRLRGLAELRAQRAAVDRAGWRAAAARVAGGARNGHWRSFPRAPKGRGAGKDRERARKAPIF